MTISSISSTTVELTGRVFGVIIAKGNGSFYKGSIGNFTDIKLGFVYSTQPISTSLSNDALVPSSGQLINTLVKPEIYNPILDGDLYGNSINWDYSMKIDTLLPNTVYYVRAYTSGLYGSVAKIKYGAQLSISTLSGAGGGHGYHISDTTVGFYDPLQVRDASEGVERVLTTDSSGLATWKPIKSLFSFGHYIGERYGGGIVAAVWREGDDEKVLIVAEADITVDTPTGTSYTSAWAYESANSLLVGSSAQSKYNGYLNTAAIVAQSITLGTTYSAAAGAAAYRGNGFEDWYLPSYYELNQVFNNLAIINKVIGSETLITSSPYWTSTEYPLNSINGYRLAYVFSVWGGGFTSTYTTEVKNSFARVRPVRKESAYTGDGLILNLDATKKKSFSDTDYLNIGIESKWKDLVNGGMTSSYSFNLSAYPTTPTGGTTIPLLTDLTTGGTSDSLAYRKMGNWGFTKINGTSTPTLYNNTGESSLVSDYFSVGTYAYLQFETIDQSTVKSSVDATINVYVSINSGTPGVYTLIRQISNTVGDNNNSSGGSPINVSLSQFSGKSISIKITAPNASYIDTGNRFGPSVDNLYVRTTTGGYQPTGPLYLPTESGFLRFNGTGSNTSLSTSFGSYASFKAPVGNTNIVTVEMWVRMRKPTTAAGMLFGWNNYDVLTRADGFGFNTGNGEIYGISSDMIQSLGLVDNWVHYVFEMRAEPSNPAVSYTSNKIYINGNLQNLSAQVAPYGINLTLGIEIPANRNFNGGVGKIGGWGSDNRYLFNGDISVFRIYNRALTKDEIMKNYSTEKKRYEILPVLMKNGLVTSINFDDSNSYSGAGTISGTVNDLSGNNVNASLVITPTTAVPAVVRTNTLYNGKELIFTGDLTTNPSLFWNTTTNITNFLAFTGIFSISISFWVKLGAIKDTPQELIVKWSDTAGFIGPWNIYQIGSYINFRLWDGVSTSSYITKSGNKTLNTGKWMHVCATYNSTTKKMKTYIDSVIDIDSSVPYGYNLVNHLGNVYVGGRPPVSYTSGAGTWVCPQGVTSVIVECWGAGGGGGGGNNQGAGGGGGGGYAKNTITVTPGTTYYWSAGAGGVAGPAGAGAANGGAGGASWFNSTNTTPTSIAGVMAGGGGGGISQTNGAGGAAGVGIYGTTRYNGGSGANGLNTADNGGGGGGGGAAGTIGNGYNGGSSLSSTTRGLAGLNGGNGGVGGGYLQSGANAGGNGTTPGGGGGGGFYFSTNNVGGGVGGSGKVSIYFNVGFAGSIANVQIYGKELSVGEIKNNYDADKFEFENFNDADKFYSHEINGNPTFSISQNLSLEIGAVSNEKILKLNDSGYSKWTDKSALFSRPENYRYIGELYGGGIIVAMWYYPKTIFNYLIMSLEDVSAGSQWSNVTNLFAGATSEFKGETNTTTIMGQGGHVTSAAKLCADYSAEGFTDWHLPSCFEMNHAFNAASIVDTVLGSDKLDGTYWTSTEPYNDNGTLNAISYSFTESGTSTGIQKTAAKTNTYKVRAFRLATNAIQTTTWDPTWDEDYTPWRRTWRDWDSIDWYPARYSVWDFDYWRDWRRTSISIDVLPLVTEEPEHVDNNTIYGNGYYYDSPQGYVSMTFSNSIYGGETVLSTGVCWSTTSTTPTLSDSVAYTISGKTKTPNIMGKVLGTPYEGSEYAYTYHFIYLRAFLTTPSGTYYSTNSGAASAGGAAAFGGRNNVIQPQGTTYSTSATTYATYPTGCFVFRRDISAYGRS